MKNKKKFTVQAARTPKTIEVAVLQGNYGYGWDDLFEFEKGATYSEIKRAKKEYDDNEPQYAHRIIHRRVPNPEYQQVSTDLNMSSGITSSTNNSLKRGRKPIKASTDLSYPYIRIFLTNLGKYNEGELVGEWVELPVDDDFAAAKAAIGIGGNYEEWFISDSETNIPGLTIGEYDNIYELNDLASAIDDMDEDEILIMSAYIDAGESIEDAIDKCDNGYVYHDCYTDQDLGYAMVDDPSELSKDVLEMYFDYESFGRSERINQSLTEIEPGTWVGLIW